MPHTLTPRVWFEAALLSGLCVLLCRRFLGTTLALVLVLSRMAIAIAYLEIYYKTSWITIDGSRYFNGGAELVAAGYNPVSVLTTGSGIHLIQTIATGNQIGAFWWNLFWQYLFGSRVCAPILASVAVTIVAAFYMYRIALACGARRRYAQIIGVAMMLHPEMIGYSSFANYKDSIVLCTTVIMLYYLLVLYRRFSTAAVLAEIGCGLLVISMRFYVPLVVAAAFGFWWLLAYRGRGRLWILPLVAAGAFFAARHIGLISYVNLASTTFVAQQWLYGIVHFLLSPRPYALNVNEIYLYPGALLNWILFPVMIIGLVALWRDAKNARLLIIYAILLVIAFGSSPIFEEYRERYQFYFVLGWGQMHGILWLWRKLAQLPMQTRVWLPRPGGTET